jgi:hypothetical protein
MNADQIADDRLTTALGSLPLADVAPAQADRIRARCRATMAGGTHRHPSWTAASWTAWRRVLEPALVAGVSVAFLLEVVGRALSLEGF